MVPVSAANDGLLASTATSFTKLFLWGLPWPLTWNYRGWFSLRISYLCDSGGVDSPSSVLLSCLPSVILIFPEFLPRQLFSPFQSPSWPPLPPSSFQIRVLCFGLIWSFHFSMPIPITCGCYALEMWLVWIEMCSNCKIYIRFQRPTWKNHVIFLTNN